jgi:cyclin G-associated kinase
MHTVLWSGNTWKAISLGDVLEPKQVKLQYRKAMLIVHPDRLSNHSAEIRYIGKRVFEAINEAYQEFLKKESV